jgi:hypothetical protein
MLVDALPDTLLTCEMETLYFRLRERVESCRVTLTCRGETLLESRYYSAGSFIAVQGVRTLLEEYLERQELPCATFHIESEEGDDISFTAVYCICNLSDTTGERFLPSHFLTTATAKHLSVDGRDQLSFITSAEESLHYRLYVSYEVADKICTTTLLKEATADIGGSALAVIDLSVAAVKSDVEELEQGAEVCLQSITVECGARAITYYVLPERSDEVFIFRNCFNVLECAELHCTTTVQTKVSRSQTTCNGAISFYDRTIEKSYEVQTAPLPIDEALWLEQMLYAHKVHHAPRGCSSFRARFGSQREVLITESTCEVQDDREELNTIKFKWREASVAPTLHVEEETGIFDTSFNSSFA